MKNKLTPEQVSKLSEFELNKSIWLRVKNPRHNYKDERVLNYCGDWDKLMPLVEKYDISFDSKNKRALYFDGLRYEISYSGNGVSLQRALAECLLFVLEEKEDE